MFDKQAYNKKYHRINREKILERNRIWKKNNPEKMAVSRKKHQLKSTYGLSLEDYNRLFLAQNGLCAGCYLHQTQTKRSLVVDHSHSTGKVRGLLCHACNTALGMAKDKPEILRRLADYLEK